MEFRVGKFQWNPYPKQRNNDTGTGGPGDVRSRKPLCRNCGHIIVGTKAPEVCPVCDHPQSYFEVHAENY